MKIFNTKTSSIVKGRVETFNNLPTDIVGESGNIYIVNTTTGNIPFRKLAGLYKSDGVDWIRMSKNSLKAVDSDKLDGHDSSYFSQSVHNHDDKYYSKNVVDDKNDLKRNISDSYSKTEIDGKDNLKVNNSTIRTSEDPTRNYNDSEDNKILSEKKIAEMMGNKSDSDHNHDSIYSKLSDIVDDLTTTTTDKTLSANQGKILKDLIDNINTILSSDDTTLDELQEVVNFIKQNKDDLQNLGIGNIAGLQVALDGKENSFIKKTAFNKEFGNTVGTVSEGNHTHDAVQIIDLNSSVSAIVNTMDLNVLADNVEVDSSNFNELDQSNTDLQTILDDIDEVISNKSNVGHTHRSKQLVDIQANRVYLYYEDNRWISLSDDNYSTGYVNNYESAGTGTSPIIEWENNGMFFPLGTTLDKLYMIGRVDNVEVTDLKILVYVTYDKANHLTTDGYNNDNDLTNIKVFDGNWVDTSRTGPVNRKYKRVIDLGGYTLTADAEVRIFIKPIGTLTKRRYFKHNSSLLIRI